MRAVLLALILVRAVLLALILVGAVLLALVLLSLGRRPMARAPLILRPMARAPDTLSATLASHVETWPGLAAVGVVACDRCGDDPGAEVVATEVVATEVVAATGPLDERFEWASVTKLLVCLASLVALEEGSVTLEDAAGPPGSTLAHLLAHASGLPFQGDQPIARPATNRIYSNTGIEIAAAHLEARTGISFSGYLSAGVLEPLGMSSTLLNGSPAHGASGPLEDLLLLAGEMLAPSLVSPETMRLAATVAWPGLSGVLPGFGRQAPCDWGLGPRSVAAKPRIGRDNRTRRPPLATSGNLARCSGSTLPPASPWSACALLRSGRGQRRPGLLCPTPSWPGLGSWTVPQLGWGDTARLGTVPDQQGSSRGRTLRPISPLAPLTGALDLDLDRTGTGTGTARFLAEIPRSLTRRTYVW